MKTHADSIIKKIKILRNLGYSINELVKKFSIPKTTIWYHVHNIKISSKYISILNSKRGGSRKRKEKNWEMAKKYAEKLLQSAKREYMIALAMLYWGEGSKKKCEFINSDGRMIKLYLEILMDSLKIEKERIIPIMRIFSGMEKEKCLSYWSKITGFSKNKFIIRFNDGGTKGRTKYGLCRISVKKGGNILKIIQLSIFLI